MRTVCGYQSLATIKHNWTPSQSTSSHCKDDVSSIWSGRKWNTKALSVSLVDIHCIFVPDNDFDHTIYYKCISSVHSFVLSVHSYKVF